MNYLLISFLILCKIFYSSSDNYVKYYNLSNDAEVLYKAKKYKAALKQIKIAFEQVGYIHNQKLMLAAEIAIANKENKLAHKYLQQGFSQGVLFDFVKEDSVFLNFRSTKEFKDLSEKYETLRNAYLKRINQDYSNELDSLYYIDQFIVRSSTEKPKKVFAIKKENHVETISDSMVFQLWLS